MKDQRIGRRAFLALAGSAGLGSAALAGSPASGLLPYAVSSRPGWVKLASHPKLRIDDSVYRRFDKRRCVFPTASGGSLAAYVGTEAERAMLEMSRGAAARLAGRPGFRAKDRALVVAARTVIASVGGSNAANRGIMSWTGELGQSDLISAEEWADPAVAARDVKAAARLFGAALVGITRIDRRHFYSHDLDGKAVSFENTAAPYEAPDRRVIPESCGNVVVYAVKMSSEAVKRAPTAISTASANVAYSQLAMLGSSLAAFIRSMGYLAIPSINDTAVSVPLAVDAGLGEVGRHNRLITPEFGPMVRLGKLVTSLPLAVDYPIDAGIREFCQTCAKCAEACPSGAINPAPEPSMTPQGPWNNAGHEAWHEDAVKCYSYTNSINSTCMICFSVCPFAKKSRAAIHGLVKATISRTDALNGVIRSVDDAFGYGGQKNPDGWWDLDLPPFGLD